MAHDFKVGDQVEWNSEAGRVRGTIKKRITSEITFKGYTVHASKKEPQYLIKSDKTDHMAMHKGSALRRLGRPPRAGNDSTRYDLKPAMTYDDDCDEQYRTDENLRIRIETHQRYTVGPPLEPGIDCALSLEPGESLLDVGTGPGGFPQRLRRSGHRGRIVGVDASGGMIAKAKLAGGRCRIP